MRRGGLTNCFGDSFSRFPSVVSASLPMPVTDDEVIRQGVPWLDGVLSRAICIRTHHIFYHTILNGMLNNFVNNILIAVRLRRLDTLIQELIFRDVVDIGINQMTVVELGCLGGTVKSNCILYAIMVYFQGIITYCDSPAWT